MNLNKNLAKTTTPTYNLNTLPCQSDGLKMNDYLVKLNGSSNLLKAKTEPQKEGEGIEK